MRITSTAINGSSQPRRKSGARASDSNFSIGEPANDRGAMPLAGPAPLSNVGALLAVQQAESGLANNQGAVARGTRMLDLLDDLKVGILEGKVPGHKLDQLARAVKDATEESTDRRLTEILKQIDLRARVELAKLGRDAA